MAEGFFNARNTDAALVAESAGVGALDGKPPSPPAVAEMKRRGIDILRHRARNISSIAAADYDMVVALDKEVAALFSAAFPEYPDTRTWIVPDPYGGSTEEYREAADMISVRVEKLIHSIP
ncbi:MAG: low molecular weight phosphatase family protein [Anaerolineales bacterium]|nr:low molecular weight phosphatase family protein [Anaerolineales bacterium]